MITGYELFTFLQHERERSRRDGWIDVIAHIRLWSNLPTTSESDRQSYNILAHDLERKFLHFPHTGEVRP